MVNDLLTIEGRHRVLAITNLSDLVITPGSCVITIFTNMVITMQTLDHTYQVLYSELRQRCLDASFSAEFSLDGRFITQEVRGRRYWYFDMAGSDGKKKRRYVGPAEDEEITQRVESFKDLKADYRARRKIVSTLVRDALLPRPEARTGQIVEALANAGFFRLRGVLVGTVAFQCYSAILGMRLPNTAMQTGDTDFAQFHSISAAVEDTMPPMIETLREVDPTFRDIPDQNDGRHTTQFISRGGYKVEFLTPNTGSDEHDGHPASMPALGNASAQPLRFLDFLIYQPVRAIMLYGAGIPVFVPAPERFAVHKLIVASRRIHDNETADKSRKDRLQATAIMEAMIQQRQNAELADAFMEAWDRGPAWRRAIGDSLALLEEKTEEAIRSGLAEGIRKTGADPTAYDLVI